MSVQYPLPGMRSRTLSPGFTPASAIKGPGWRRASAASRSFCLAGSASAASSACCENCRGCSALLQLASRTEPSASPNANMFIATPPFLQSRTGGRRPGRFDEWSGGFGVRGRNEAAQFLMRKCAGAEEALVKVTSPFHQEAKLTDRLHALDHDLEVELP